MLLVAYLLTMAPGWTFEDTPLFSAACATLGVAQPPGYPLWVLSCAPFAALAEAVGIDPGFAAALSSVAASVAACLLLALFLRRLSGSAPAAIAAAGSCGLALTYWSQSIIAESYALNALLWIASLLAADSYSRGGKSYLLILLALLCGLGLANHWPLFLIALPSVAAWLLPAWPRLHIDLRRVFPFCLMALLVGLLPYAHLALASESSARFLGGRLLDGSLLDYVSRSSLREFDLASRHPRWDHRLAAAGKSVLMVLQSFGWPLAALGVAGAMFCRKHLSNWQIASLAWGLLGVTFILALYRPYLPQSEISAQTFANYGLSAHLVFAVALAFALARLFASLPNKARWGASAALLLALAIWNAPSVYRGADDLAPRYADQLNSSLAADTRVLLGNQSYAFALEFYPYLEAKRSRVRALPLATYLDGDEDLARLPALLAAETEPIAFAPMVPNPGVPVSWHGSYSLLADPASAGELEMDDSARELLLHAASLRDRANNVWTREFADRLLFEFARYALNAGSALGSEDAELLTRLEQQPAVRFVTFLDYIGRLEDPYPELVGRKISELGDLDELPLAWRADVLHVLAMTHARSGDLSASIAVLESALRMFPAASNQRVLTDLLALLAQEGDFVRYRQIRRRYPSLAAAGLQGFDRRCRAILNFACDK